MMKLKTVICDMLFLNSSLPHHRFLSVLKLVSVKALGIKISCSAQSSVSIFGKKLYFVFHSEIPGPVSYVQNPENAS